MKGKDKLLTAMFVLLQMTVYVLPCQAESTWSQISRGFNEAFSGSQALKNVIGFLFTILAFGLIILAFRAYLMKKEKEIHRHRFGVILRPLSSQQKRNWFRLRINAEIQWIPAAEAWKTKEGHYKKDRLVDISGGGLCFTTAEKLNPGDEIKFLLDVGGDKPLSLTGRVLRIHDEPGENKTMSKVAVQFENILNGVRDRIVCLIMKRQRDAIQEKKRDDDGSSRTEGGGEG